MLVGPECRVDNFRLQGPMIVATDASPCTRPALELAAEAASSFDYEPIVVNVVDPDSAAAMAKARTGPEGSRHAARIGHGPTLRARLRSADRRSVP